MFSWTNKELDEEQSEAIRESRSVFLVACPGSGKTRALAYKIARELDALDSPRHFVVAITYTNRAADEIKTRVEALGIDTAQLWIGTIHAFCLEWILRPYAIYEPALAYGFTVLDQHERESLLDQLCKEHAPGITHWDCDYFFTATGYSLGSPNVANHDGIHRVLEAYFGELSASRVVDFELILRYAHRLILSQPSIRQILSRLMKWILVDEYQDTKDIQYEIVTSIVKAGNGETRLFMVGDPNQSIYGSLGGYAIPAATLREKISVELVEKELSANYRSSSRIIEYFENFNVYGTTIFAKGELRDYPSLITYDSETDQAQLSDRIAALITSSVQVHGVSPNEICVLAPQWAPLVSMTRSLVVALPEYQFNGPGMVPFARDMENFWYKLARLSLTKPSPSMYVRRFRWAKEALANLDAMGLSVQAAGPRDLLKECNDIEIEELNGLNYLRRFFDQLFNALSVSIVEIPQLAAQHDAFFAGAEARIARLQSSGIVGVDTLEFFMKTFENRSGITLSTIHGVKGSEFDVVIAYGLLEGMVPNFNDTGGNESAKKLLYVAGSRARKNLHLFSETGRKRGRWNTYKATHVLAATDFTYDPF